MKELSFDTLIENITFFQMDAHIHHRLEEAGIRTLGDLVKKTRGELTSIRLFGNKCVNIVEDFLEENGWHLGMKEEKRELVLPTPNKIDWEQIRYELTKDFMSAMISSKGKIDFVDYTDIFSLVEIVVKKLRTE